MSNRSPWGGASEVGAAIGIDHVGGFSADWKSRRSSNQQSRFADNGGRAGLPEGRLFRWSGTKDMDEIADDMRDYGKEWLGVPGGGLGSCRVLFFRMAVGGA